MHTKLGCIVAFNRHIRDDTQVKLQHGSRAIENPSRYQEDIFDFVVNGEGHAQIQGVPGCGKTTTNMHCTTLMPWVGFEASTIHSSGLRLLANFMSRRPDVQPGKMWGVVRQLTSHLPYGDKTKAVQYHLKDMVDMAKLTATPHTDAAKVIAMCDQYDITVNEQAIDLLPRTMTESNFQADKAGIIDYNDMIYLPNLWDVPALNLYDYVFVDEMQDLNNSQWRIVRRLLDPTGRLIAVGDPNQGMYLFAGASASTFDQINELYGDYTTLPLSISYRCPTSHIEIAQRINPQIEARLDAPEGIIERLSPIQFIDAARPGDMALCRFNAPLFTHCLDLIRQGRRAYIKGRELHTKLIRIVGEIQAMPGFAWGNFPSYLELWRSTQIETLIGRGASQYKLDTVYDRVACLFACYLGSGATSPELLKERIKDLFNEEAESVMFSTIHRAKGLEADRVHILSYDDLPFSKSSMSPAQLQQEKYIKYVAVTRSKYYMSFVSG